MSTTNNYEQTVLQRAKEELNKIQGVKGVGLTHSAVTGIGNNHQYQILVYLENEKTISSLPAKIDEIPVVYKIVGKVQVHAFAYTRDYRYRTKSLQSLQYTNKIRPVKGGISGGLFGSQVKITGTISCFVRINDVTSNNGKTAILSNNHVFAWDIDTSQYKGLYGEPIIQPGNYDGGTSLDIIGTLEKSIHIGDTGNIIDSSYAIPGTDIKEPNVCNLYTNTSVVPSIGMNVRKAGRTTGCVDAIIEATNSTFSIDYTLHTNGGDNLYTASFDDLLTIAHQYNAPVSQPGDSGSMWLTFNGNNAVAQNFAGSDDGTSISCSAINIEQILGVKFGTAIIPSITECNIPSVSLAM